MNPYPQSSSGLLPRNLRNATPIRGDSTLISRRAAIRSTLAAASAAAFTPNAVIEAAQTKPDPRRSSPRRYDMKKSINLWAFPYPQKMSLKECLQLAKDAGFDGIELNYNLENDLSPKSDAKKYQEIRRQAEQIGIAVSGLCSFLFWPYSFTSNDLKVRERGLD